MKVQSESNVMMNLKAKKQAKDNLKQLKKVNHESHKFLDFMLEEYVFPDEQTNSIKNLQTHLLNLNLIFQSMMNKTK